MIEAILSLVALLALLFLWFFLFPVRLVGRVAVKSPVLEPPDVFIYSYVLHIHTQFSYDSLGKPEDVIRTRDELGIDYAIVTDHNNDHIKDFADDRLIAGREIKLNDEEGNLLGDLLEVGDIKVIAHHFRGKYRWRLEKRKDYLLELIDLRDALLESKFKLFLFLIAGLFLYPFMKRRVLKNYSKLVDTEMYASRALREGWRSKVVGGLDHHVKFYLREVKKRVMIPDYELSFSMMRNFVMSDVEVKDKEHFLEVLRRCNNLISFSEKPSLVWVERDSIKAYSPFKNTYMILLSGKGDRQEAVGANAEFSQLKSDSYLLLGYTYALKVGRILLGVRPLFVSDLLEVH
ncbi:hypothetical protein [Hydrogenivirga sp.]